MNRDDVANSLRTFKSRRDELLHEDVAMFQHHLERFLDFCGADPLARKVLDPIQARPVDIDAWWTAATQHEPSTSFPANSDDEFALRYALIASVREEPDRVFQLGIAHRQNKRDGWIEFFRTLVVRSFADELTHRIGNAADVATPEARTPQAVPLSRIPGSKETKIFLSHKSVDKPIIRRYYEALKTLGLAPWLDEEDMAAGANLEREIFRGFEESCAAVFFITDQFKDEKYLAAEVEYAVMQKRAKGKKFAIITLRYTNAAAVPGLLMPYVYRDVSNDLEGLNELLKALPIELERVLWKKEVV
jgi:hypothetical protein